MKRFGGKGASDMLCARQFYDADSRVECASRLKRAEASTLARELEIALEEFLAALAQRAA